jgi:hypothetical protein
MSKLQRGIKQDETLIEEVVAARREETAADEDICIAIIMRSQYVRNAVKIRSI